MPPLRMRIGVHLPQYGPTATRDTLWLASQRAEALGFADVWVSDHIVIAVDVDYHADASPFFDPLLALSWAAAATTRVGIGVSAVVAPQHKALWLAKALATLDVLSDGRLTIVAGVGWVQEEFDALGYSFHDRGRRMDEILDVLRTCWREDPTSYDGTYHRFEPVRVLPKPAHPIPIWIGGSSAAAYRRASRAGDGFQFVFSSAAAVSEPIARMRAARPEREFSISLRTVWDPAQPEALVRQRDEYAGVGVEHMVIEHVCEDSDAWFEGLNTLASVLDLPAPA